MVQELERSPLWVSHQQCEVPGCILRGFLPEASTADNWAQLASATGSFAWVPFPLCCWFLYCSTFIAGCFYHLLTFLAPRVSQVKGLCVVQENTKLGKTLNWETNSDLQQLTQLETSESADYGVTHS